MMALSGAWAERAQIRQTGARKWGTGINPIHSINEGDEGRNYQVLLTAGGTHDARSGFAAPPQNIVQYPDEEDYIADNEYAITGYGELMGTNLRPDWGQSSGRGSTDTK